MNLPAIGIASHFISIEIHPRAEAISPQEDPTLWLSNLHTQQPQNLGSNLFPITCTTQGMGSLFSEHSPSGLPTSLLGSSAFC
jgi:hypothetical protein